LTAKIDNFALKTGIHLNKESGYPSIIIFNILCSVKNYYDLKINNDGKAFSHKIFKGFISNQFNFFDFFWEMYDRNFQLCKFYKQ
jgi:hypothetical protein